MIDRRHFSGILIFMLLAGAFAAGLWREEIELHRLERILLPGMDAFGRNCLALSFSAISHTLGSILPVLGFTLLASIGVALVASGPSRSLRFALRSVLDFFSALPGLLLALSLGVLFSDLRLTSYLATTLLVMPSTIRYFESALLKIRSEDFIGAARSLGASPLHIWIHHLLPALRDSVLTVLPFVMLRLVLIETSLSFLGLTPAPEHETWGRMLAQGKDYLMEAPWILFSSAFPLFLLLASLHLLSHEQNS